MPSRLRHPEWRSSLDNTKYPFAPGVSLTNVNGIVIPDNSFIDAHFYPIGGTSGIYLSKLSVSNTEITFHIGDESSLSIATGILEIRLLSATTKDKRGVVIQLVDAYNRPAGIIVSDPIRLSVFGSFEIGDHVFLQEQTEFVATVCMPTPEIGVRGVILSDGTVMPDTEDDALWFVGGDGIILTHEQNTAAGNCNSSIENFPTIRIDAVGDPLFLRKLCAPVNSFTTPNFIKTLRIQNTVEGCVTDEWDIDVSDRDGKLFIQGNDELAPHTALRVRTTNEDTIEIIVAGSPIYEV